LKDCAKASRKPRSDQLEFIPLHWCHHHPHRVCSRKARGGELG
jgi:hypothetical protein